jgi:hypothetical protein
MHYRQWEVCNKLLVQFIADFVSNVSDFEANFVTYGSLSVTQGNMSISSITKAAVLTREGQTSTGVPIKTQSKSP